jgi:hypothetical protein
MHMEALKSIGAIVVGIFAIVILSIGTFHNHPGRQWMSGIENNESGAFDQRLSAQISGDSCFSPCLRRYPAALSVQRYPVLNSR